MYWSCPIRKSIWLPKSACGVFSCKVAIKFVHIGPSYIQWILQALKCSRFCEPKSTEEQVPQNCFNRHLAREGQTELSLFSFHIKLKNSREPSSLGYTSTVMGLDQPLTAGTFLFLFLAIGYQRFLSYFTLVERWTNTPLIHTVTNPRNDKQTKNIVFHLNKTYTPDRSCICRRLLEYKAI